MRRLDVDLVELSKRLFSVELLVFLAVGALAGHLAGVQRGMIHEQAFAVSFAPTACLDSATFAHQDTGFTTRLPAGLLDGYDLRESDVPQPVQDHYLECRILERSDRDTVSCAVRGPREDEVARLARKAKEIVRAPLESPLGVALSEHRVVSQCGWDYLMRIAGANGDDRPNLKGSMVMSTPTMVRVRQANSLQPTLLEDPPAQPPRPALRIGAILGALLGLLAFLLRAVRRTSTLDPLEDALPNRVGEFALAGLLLTLSMDRVLVLDAGPFTLRFGHVCALLLFVSGVALSVRAKRPVPMSRALLTAAILYLGVALISAFWTDQPTKTLGYLAWATFDLAVVLTGVAIHLASPARVARALDLWLAGMCIAVGMGAVQTLSWLAGMKPPLVWMTSAGFPRLNGFSYEPSYYCLYLIPGAFLLLTRFSRLGAAAWRSVALAGIFLIAIGLSTSRSGWFGVAAGMLLLLGRAGLRRDLKGVARVAAALGVVALVCGVILVAWPALRQNVTRLSAMAFDRWEASSTGPRLESLRQAGELAKRHPWLGVGFANYGAYVLNHPEFPQPDAGAFAVVTTNLFLELTAETGLIGFLLALALITQILAPLLRPPSKEAGAGLPARDAVDREGLLVAAVLVFGVLFQFSQTLWRLDIWALLSLCFAAGRAPRQPLGKQSDAAGDDGTREERRGSEEAPKTGTPSAQG